MRFMNLPHPVEIDPTDLFMQYVRDARFPAQGNDGSIPIGSTSRVALCHEIMAAKDLSWSYEDVRAIVNRLVEWWDTDKARLNMMNMERFLSLPSLADEIKKPLWELVDTITTMVARHSDAIDGSDRNAVKRVVEEILEHGLPALRLEMACVSLFPECRDRILRRVKYEMTSTDNDVVVDALSAVRVVADRAAACAEEGGSDKEDLMKLLRSVGNRVRWRTDPAAAATLGMVANIVEVYPWILVDDIECSVLQGLHRLVDATSVNGPDGASMRKSEGGQEVSRKLLVRREAARLAHGLFRHYRQRGHDIPQTILAWEQVLPV